MAAINQQVATLQTILNTREQISRQNSYSENTNANHVASNHSNRSRSSIGQENKLKNQSQHVHNHSTVQTQLSSNPVSGTQHTSPSDTKGISSASEGVLPQEGSGNSLPEGNHISHQDVTADHTSVEGGACVVS